VSVIFSWREDHLDALLRSCERDEARAIVARHFLPGSHLLEAGCGAGRWVRYLTDYGYRVVGLEYSHETVAMVKKAWPDLEVVRGNCEASPFGDGEFDGVLSFGVVEHWKEGPRKPLQDIFRVLKPGGKALITVPCFNEVRRLKRLVWWDEITQSPRALLAWVVKGKVKPLSRVYGKGLYRVFPAWGEFFEYRMSVSEFAREVAAVGFRVLEHSPLGGMDGIYHELNPVGCLVGWEEWRFEPTRLALLMNRILARSPFFHSHMQAIVAEKPLV